MQVRIAYGDQYGYWVSDDVTIANGIAWAYQHGASILNNSWGGGGEIDCDQRCNFQREEVWS